MNHARFFVAAGLLAVAVAAGAQQATTKTYIVQLADAPAATYDGRIAGLTATRPVTGAKIDSASTNVRAYVRYLSTKANSEMARVGASRVVHRYSYGFNGFAARLTDAQAQALKTSANVLSVTENEIRKLETTRTPAFLGLSTPGGLWSQLDASARPVKGEDVIIGMIDSGVWPEDPSFGDRLDANNKPLPYSVPGGTQAYGAAPAKYRGICQVGEGFTAAMCNGKLIGARYYVAGFNAGGGTLDPFEYRSPRAGGGDGGHGIHTSSTAGGNENVDASINGVAVGVMSGIAPRARISTYKVCWEATTTAQTGCYTADTLKAIDDAIADGVDVINFSVSGTQTNFLDPVEISYFNASAAGIFVAASAGNSGPANTVAHMSPWLTTVAASTHDRYTVANVVLSTGGTFPGPSYQASGLTAKPLINAQDAGTVPFTSLSAADQTALMRCYNAADRASLGGSTAAALDPTKVSGKILVCIRGGNVLVNKGDAATTAGAAGMIIQNAPGTANTVILQPYPIPTVHLDVSAYPAVFAAAAAGASASFTGAVQVPNVIAPVMADFSSRGPNLANANILKPDITAPGVDIIAAWSDTTLTQAQHDALVANAYTPGSNANSIQGTSMSSPHVAGSAALIKQLHPTWSPAMIKSALMTTTNTVKLASGAVDPNRFGYGAGHLNPTPASDPGLVYDIGTSDYGRFLCGLALAPPAGAGSCTTLGSIQPWNLNLASLTAVVLGTNFTMTRTVKNVGAATSTYVATATLPGWNVTVTPSSLVLSPGASASYTVALSRSTAALNAYTFGNLTWSDNVHTVSSPLTAYAPGFVTPAEVSDVRPAGRGSKVFQVVSAYSGTMGVSALGLVPATLSSNKVAGGATQCVNTVIPAGTQVARFQLFNADTQGGSATDLDLAVFNGPNGTGTSVGSSGGSTSDEVVTLIAPAAGTYSACVTGFSVPSGGATYTLSSWAVGPASGVPTLKVAGPSAVYAGGSASVSLGWSTTAAARYLGYVTFTDPASAALGSTIVSVDNH